MIAILCGLGAAACWAVTMLTGTRASRSIGPTSALAWVMLTGLVIVGPIALAQGVPDGLDGQSATWLVIAGAGNVAGLLLVYAGVRIGKIGVVAPIASTEGAVAAVIAVIAGEELGMWSGLALGIVVVGVVLSSRPAAEPDGELGDPRAVLFGIAAACAFGASLYATGRASADLTIVWAVLPPRLLGVLFVTIPLLAARRLRLTREAAPFVVASGIAEVVGFVFFATGARHGIAVTAVLASQFAAIAALAARFLFGERIGRTATIGVVVIAFGVALVSALRV